jgi:chromosome segregation protein
MLKRLELVGFKSFADKTQFDFPAGITGIVGPNGSGKSNIVDAVRWVLGEQSAKSLRGGEMADVIFNGSTSRRSLGLAEVTMTFDNRRRLLATEAEEVQITRRVYRSGEGEYLINHQLCRLKDVKELFLGSGAATEAYSIIQQGQVDVLLQASTRDRRVIFEEAAGISRFKAKKIETVRRLERVDQNLLRLKDIIEEVEKQLRSVKLQASKAQRYQEYSERLKQLRVGLGLQEYQQLTQRLEAESAVLDGLRKELEVQGEQAAAWESQTRQLEEALARLEETTHEQESLLAAARQQIATEENTLGHERSLSAGLESDLAEARGRLMEQSARVTALGEAAREAAAEVEDAERQARAQRDIVRSLADEHQHAILRLGLLQRQVQADKTEHLEQMRQAARLQNDATSYKAQVDNLRREHERLSQKTRQAAEHLATLDVELRELTDADESLQGRLATARQTLADQKQERERLRQVRDDTTQIVADLRAERRGLASRIEVLEGLEKSHEGLGTGVREVLEIVAQPTPTAASEQSSVATSAGEEGVRGNPWDTIIGMVADLLTVRHEYAPLIDLALGERAEHFLVRDVSRLAEALQQRAQPFAGRVAFVPLSPGHTEQAAARPNRLIEVSPLGRVRMPVAPEGTPAHPGVVAAAEQVVACEQPGLADLPAQLLKRTLIVRDLDAARAIAAHTSGFRFVTLQGELFEADGTLTVGTHHAETGILSRKSELRELRLEAVNFDNRIVETERDLADVRDRVTALDGHTASLQEEITVLAEQEADLRSRLSQRRQRREGLHEEVALDQTEISGLEREIQQLEEAWQRSSAQAESAEQKVKALQARLEQADAEIAARELERTESEQQCTAAKVALAQTDERLTALRAKARQVEDDLRQRRQELAQGEERQVADRARLEESQRTLLRSGATLARAYIDKEDAERRLSGLTEEREAERRRRQQLADQAQSARASWQTQQEQAHARELEVSDLRHRRTTLVERLKEDYQIDLAELYQSAVGSRQSATDQGSQLATADCQLPTEVDASTANEAIADLRKKLSRLGNVNLESLAELAELETRAATLQTQYDDLASAKKSLEEIIAKINVDSRRLFEETFESIRGHFQELFRKLFGGGMADIVLEDENDILECGIEVVARPPGKELRSISLMSGGEKTLTAVALLLGIFRSKPSPFCILDEVDAALDEANIGRFTSVLHDFLDQSHFIIVTHSKRTMSVADVLYGITMQESGVSKRVAVRFEDWPSEEQSAVA